MEKGLKIEFLRRREIREDKWDRVISESTAETIYPYSWYLDAVAENWSALVAGDYRFLMPVVWKKKAGMKYIYQPYYTQQLGVFSREYVEPELIRKLFSILYRKFRFAGMNINAKNLFGEVEPYTVEDKSNYILNLSPAYASLHRSFSTNTKRNIRNAQEHSDVLEKNLPVQELVRLKRENDVIKRSGEDYLWMANLLETVKERQAGRIYALLSGNEVISGAFFAFSKTRTIYLLSVSSPKGKEHRGMFRIIDTLIKDYAGSGLILDFEGSNIPSVARFFGGFGAQAEIYQGVSFSRLPPVLSSLK